MALKEFLKRLLSPENKTEEHVEKINLTNLPEKINSKKNEYQKKEREILELIQNLVFKMILELEERVRVLDKVSVSEKKVEEKVKIIVRENLIWYVSHTKKLIQSLKNLDKESPIEDINKKFSDFEKKSEPSFQKATFLIGKELSDVKDSISSFFKELKEIIKENKEFFDNYSIIKLADKKIFELENLKKSQLEIEEQMKNTELLEDDKKKAIEILNREISSVKKSEKYIEKQKQKEKYKKSSEELKKELDKLRESIDFKALASVFHVSEKKMALIKEYKDNFYSEFMSDSGEGLVDLLNESKLNPEIPMKIKEIIKKHEELAEFKEEDETKEIESNIKKIETELEKINEEKTKQEKRLVKLGENQTTLISEIRTELIKIGLELQ